MTASSAPNTFISGFCTRAEAVAARAVTLGGGLGKEQLNWRPPEGGWSTGQCFEHLTITGDRYYERLSRALEKARQDGGLVTSSETVYRPSLIGRFFINAVGSNSTRKLKAPAVFVPPDVPRENVVEEFRRSMQRLRELALRADGVDLSRVKIASPLSPLIRFNAGDALTLIVAHAGRHLNQAQRIVEHPVFPGTVR